MNSTSIIKGFRGKKLLSQENVAELLGITRQSYNSLENNLLNGDCTLVFKLLDVLNLNDQEIEEFFSALKQDYKSYQNN